jgi:hypothetical protein
MEVKELTAFGVKVFGSVGKQTDMTHAHETFGDNVEQEAADKFVGLEGHDLFSAMMFSVSVTKSDFSVMGGNNPIVGQCHTVSVVAEVIENMVRRAERFFGIGDPRF